MYWILTKRRLYSLVAPAGWAHPMEGSHSKTIRRPCARYFEVGKTYICGHLCVTSLSFCICSPNTWALFYGWGGEGSAAECHLQLLERKVFSVARLCPDQSFLWLCHRRRVAGISMLYNVNSNSNHFLFSELPSAPILEFDISELRPQLIHGSLKYQGVGRPDLLCLSYRLRFECACKWPSQHCVSHQNAGWVQERCQQLVDSLSCVFFSFSWRRCLWGCESNL